MYLSGCTDLQLTCFSERASPHLKAAASEMLKGDLVPNEICSPKTFTHHYTTFFTPQHGSFMSSAVFSQIKRAQNGIKCNLLVIAQQNQPGARRWKENIWLIQKDSSFLGTEWINSTATHCWRRLVKEEMPFIEGKQCCTINHFPKMGPRREEENNYCKQNIPSGSAWVRGWGRWGCVSPETESPFTFLI